MFSPQKDKLSKDLPEVTDYKKHFSGTLCVVNMEDKLVVGWGMPRVDYKKTFVLLSMRHAGQGDPTIIPWAKAFNYHDFVRAPPLVPGWAASQDNAYLFEERAVKQYCIGATDLNSRLFHGSDLGWFTSSVETPMALPSSQALLCAGLNDGLFTQHIPRPGKERLSALFEEQVRIAIISPLLIRLGSLLYSRVLGKPQAVGVVDFSGEIIRSPEFVKLAPHKSVCQIAMADVGEETLGENYERWQRA